MSGGSVPPKIHLLGSYGLLNYPFLGGDYARVGMALYGVLSTGEDTRRWGAQLRPVLSLYARLSTLRTLYPGSMQATVWISPRKEKRAWPP